MSPLLLLLFPDLLSFDARERARALRSASATPLDFVELGGIALGLVVVTVLTRYSVATLGLGDRILLFLANFAVAFPLLALWASPFFVRRIRRGLREQLQGRAPREGATRQ